MLPIECVPLLSLLTREVVLTIETHFRFTAIVDRQGSMSLKCGNSENCWGTEDVSIKIEAMK